MKIALPSAAKGLTAALGLFALSHHALWPAEISISNATVIEGNSGATNAVFVVSLSETNAETVTVDYATANETASAGLDYEAASGTITFLPGTTEASIMVAVSGDLLNESSETFFVNLSNVVNATLNLAQGTGTIANDDPIPALSISDVTVLEGDSGTTNAVFGIALSAASGQTVTVQYYTADGTASVGSDYTIHSGTLIFPPGMTNQTATVTVSGDGLSEANETFFLNLFDPVHATVARSQGVGTISDDDPLPSLSIDDVVVIEGNSGVANAILTLTLSAVSGQIVLVDYETTNGTATAESDYVSASGSVSFQPGVTLQTVTLVILGDTANELSETVLLNLSNPVHVTLARSQGVATINNDDPLPTLSVSNVSVAEGDSGTTSTIFTVSLLPASGRTVTVDYATTNGTATAGQDYTASSGSVTFPAGTTNQTFTVPVSGDPFNETNETFLINLSNSVNATLAQGQGVGTILNDDPLPVLAITDVAVGEGDSGVTNAVFVLSLSAVSGQTLTVNFSTTNGSATGGSDFVTNSGILTYPPGTTNRTITVVVNADRLNEADETFGVNLFNPVNVSLSQSQGVGMILNDDPVPSLAINDVVVKEGDSGTTNAVFVVSLSAASGLTVTVNYATADGTANADNDYTAAAGSLSFPSGTTNRTITVAVKGDTAFEADETFFVDLSNPGFATVARSRGIGTILEDEVRTNSFTNAATIRIANSGPGTPYPSTIELSGWPGTISKVAVGLNGLTHTFPDDIDVLLVGPNGQKILLMSDAGGGNALNNVNLTFEDAASSTLPDSSQINSGTFKPTDYTPGEFFPSPAPVAPYSSLLSILNGANPNGTWALYVLDDTSGDSGNIVNGWRLTLATTNVICCAAGVDADLSVTLTDSPDPALTDNNLVYRLVVINNGPANATGVLLTNTLPAGVNFVSAISSQGSCARTNNIVSCALGNLGLGASATVNITVNPSVVGLVTNLATVKGNQTDTNSGNNIAATVTTVTPSPPEISINDVSVAELNVVATNAVFTVSLSQTNDQSVTVNYATANGTASAGSDYTASSGTLVFSPGTTNRTLTVTVNGDALIEPNETFFVNLSGPVNGTIARSRGTGTIINDDALLGQLDHFNWSAIAPTQYLNTPFLATLTAVDLNNNLITNFAGTVALDGLVGSGASLSVLITEIDTDEDKVEISNVTGFSFDLSGWQVTMYDWLSWPDPTLTFAFPPGTMCGAGEVFLIRDNGTFPGAYPAFFTGTNIAWLNENTNNQVAVLLRNAAGQIIDFACAVDGFRTEISVPGPIPSTEWQGLPISANVDPAFTYQRTGNSDHSTAVDWVLAQNSAGVRNTGLNVPFPGPRPVTISPTASGSFVNGSWTGSFTVLELSTNMYLRADDGSAHRGFSGEFTVNPTTDLGLTNSGSPLVVSIGQNLTYTLVVTNHGLINAAGVVVTDPLPGGLNYTSATSSQGTVTQSSNTVTINIGTLTNGTRATITINVTPTAPGMITNVASVTAATLDHNSTNDSASAVIRVNFPPTISGIGDQTTYEDTPSSPSSFTIDDVETAPEVLSLSGISSNTNVVANTNIVFGGSGMNRTVTSVPSLNQPGSTTITVYVSDGMDVRSTNFVLTVNPVNDPPSFTKGANPTALEDAGLQSVPGWATAISFGPPDEAAQALTFVVTNDNSSLFSVQPAVATNGTLTFMPAPHVSGSATVMIQLRDNGGTANGGSDMSSPQSFTISILSVNDAPGFTKGPNQTIAEDAGLITINGWATAISAGPADESAQALSFLVSNNNNGLFLNQPAISPGGALSFITATNAHGTATVTARLQDNGGTANGGSDTSAPQTFTITITGVNDPPVLTAIPGRTIGEGSTLIVTNVAVDPDVPTDILTYSLEPGSPSGVSINATNGILTWTPGEAQGPSTNIIAVRVTDNGLPGLSDAKSFTIIVQEVNSAPVLPTIANQTVSESSLLSLPISATDGDIPANSLTYSLEPGAPMGVTLNPSTGVLTWTPGETQGPSTNVITVRVNDDGTPGMADTKSFTVVVREVNSAPVIDPIPDRRISEGSSLSFTITVADVDLPANTMTFSLVTPPSGATIESATGLFSWTPTQGPSTNVLTVHVTDNGTPSLSDTRSFTVVVVPPPRILGLERVDNSVRLVFTTAVGQSYTVEYRDTLGPGPWSVLTTVPGTGGAVSVTDSGPLGSTRFYRVRTD